MSTTKTTATQDMALFAAQVRLELRMARRKHATPIHSLHEGYAVILEELDEFWQEVKRQDDKRSRTLMLLELVQVAAMCQRVAEDCGLMAAFERVTKEAE